MKLNAKSKSIMTVNEAGMVAYKLSDKLELVTRACTSFWKEAKFYGEADAQAKSFIELAERVSSNDPVFVFKLAAYCRQEMKLRTVSVVLFVVAANNSGVNMIEKHRGLARSFAPKVIERADEVMEAVAFQLEQKGSKAKFPKNLQRGLADVLLGFDEYQLAKYDRDGAVKLKDAIILLHPKPKTKAKAALLKRALEGKLETPKTWEVEISTKGSTKENWESIAPSMGYMALIRNLRSFLEKGCKMKPILKRIEDEEEILKSKQLPFRFLSAYRELQSVSSSEAGTALESVSNAFEVSMRNVKELKGTTVVLVDHSASMNSPVSEKSKVSLFDAAATLALIVNARSKKSNILVFSDDCKIVNLRKGAGLDGIETLKAGMHSSNTNIGAVFDLLISKKIVADRIILLSDEQENQGDAAAGVWGQYRKKINPNAMLYAVDLGGYGKSAFAPSNGVVKLAGFSERLLDVVRTVESGGSDKIVQTIEKAKY